MDKEGRNAFMREVAHKVSEKVVVVLLALVGAAIVLSASGCTQQIPGSFRFAQERISFATAEINTKVDFLWVVDNSASMDASQAKLRAGAVDFASKYITSGWDMRLAVIPSDLYLANAAYNGYLTTPVPFKTNATTWSGTGAIAGTSTALGWYSYTYQASFNSGWSSAWVPSLVNGTSSLYGANGLQIRHYAPGWRPLASDITKSFAAGSTWAHLLPGLHDGPIVGYCYEGQTYFWHGSGVTKCTQRDAGTTNAATAKSDCLQYGDTDYTKCVNTTHNDVIHSGRAIIETKNNDIAQARDDFRLNLSVGTVGSGSERPIGSVLQFMETNEGSPIDLGGGNNTRFFRQGSVRAIVFVTDENDQTMESAAPAAGHYVGTPTGLATFVTSWPNYQLGDATHCVRTVDGTSFTLAYCPVDDVTTKLVAISDIKSRLDRFFCQLDYGTDTCDSPNYFIATITPTVYTSIQNLQNARNAIDDAIGLGHTIAVDKADRLEALVDAVPGSIKADIIQDDFGVVMKSIGSAIVKKRGTFTLNKAVDDPTYMIVKIVHANGKSEDVSKADYTLSGKTLTITNVDVLLGMAYNDSLYLDYQPTSQY